MAVGVSHIRKQSFWEDTKGFLEALTAESYVQFVKDNFQDKDF
jgi:hypothetical protein